MDKVYDISTSYHVLAGFIGVNKSRIVIVFRGTVNLINTLSDANIIIGKYIQKENLKFGINKSIKDAVDKLKLNIRKHLVTLFNAYPKAEILITGHSLGGSLANMASMALEDEGYIKWGHVSAHTYGQLRTGDQEYANYMNIRTGGTFLRAVSSGDIFIDLPKRFNGYSHKAHLKFYENNQELPCDPDNEGTRCFSFIDPLKF